MLFQQRGWLIPYPRLILLVTHFPQTSENYEKLLNYIDGTSHLTVAVNHCSDESCIPVVENNTESN